MVIPVPEHVARQLFELLAVPLAALALYVVVLRVAGWLIEQARR